MRLSAILPTISLLVSLTAADSPSSASQPASADVLYWPVTSPQPTTLAHISYDATSLTSHVISYSPPKSIDHSKQSENDDQVEDLVRLGLYISTQTNLKQWVGTLTTWSSLVGNGDLSPTLRLHLDSSNNEVYQVSLSPNHSNTSSPTIELVPNTAGPRPHLNRPVIVGPDGKNPEEVVEKTLFQKYWWVFLIITFLAMSGSGEGQ